jgi:O-antigen/teichoic acid export membrane protein
LLDTQALGIYAAITDIVVQINSLSALVIQPLLPNLSNLNAQQDVDNNTIYQQVKHAFQLNALIAIGLGGTLITLSNFTLYIIISENAANLYILPFCIATSIYAFYSINAAGYYVSLSMNMLRFCATIQLLAGFISLLLITIGAYQFKLYGAILGNSGYLLTLLVNLNAMKKISLPKYLWVKWLSFPIAWYICFVLINLAIPSNIYWTIITVFLQNIILISWYMIVQIQNNNE